MTHRLVYLLPTAIFLSPSVLQGIMSMVLYHGCTSFYRLISQTWSPCDACGMLSSAADTSLSTYEQTENVFTAIVFIMEPRGQACSKNLLKVHRSPLPTILALEENHTNVSCTFDWGVGRRSFDSQVPRRVSLVGKVPHFKVADGEANDGRLVQLAGDGAGQRKHLRQLVELEVFLAPARAGGVTRLLLPQSLQPGGNARTNI